MNFSLYKTFDLNNITSENIPKTRGLYIYKDKINQEIKYIGSAVGKYGLRGRIWSQHLNEKYLEGREEKFSEKDAAQIEKQIRRNGKVVIEKSAFRKNIARYYNLAPGKECLQFIKNSYTILIIPCPDKSSKEILEIEETMISEYKPPFNIKKKIRQPYNTAEN